MEPLKISLATSQPRRHLSSAPNWEPTSTQLSHSSHSTTTPTLPGSYQHLSIEQAHKGISVGFFSRVSTSATTCMMCNPHQQCRWGLQTPSEAAPSSTAKNVVRASWRPLCGPGAPTRPIPCPTAGLGSPQEPGVLTFHSAPRLLILLHRNNSNVTQSQPNNIKEILHRVSLE